MPNKTTCYDFRGARAILSSKNQLESIERLAELTDLSSREDHDVVQQVFSDMGWEIEKTIFPVKGYRLDAYNCKTGVEVERSLIDAVHRSLSLFRCIWAHHEGLLDKHGLRMPGTTAFSKDNVAWLRGLDLGFMDDAILRSDLVLLETVDEQVEHIEKIATLAAEDRRVRLLMTMTGVGYFTVMLVVSEVGDIGRFRGDKEFASWMGLVPSVHQSGERTRIGGVSGPGNTRLRWALVESAQAAVRYDPRLGGMFERLSRRRGAGCAVVAVAHEMARIMYFMLVREEPYRGENRGLMERKLKNMGKRALDGLRN